MACLALALACPAGATVLITIEEALALAFPGAVFERQTLFLTEEQMERAEDLAGHRPRSPMVTRYTAAAGDQVVGWAYLDTHRVRTLAETILVVVGPDGFVRRVEVVSFREPLDYLPPDSWYGQYEDRELNEKLELKRAIRPITGATLTARATTDAVRRALAIHSALGEEEAHP